MIFEYFKIISVSTFKKVKISRFGFQHKFRNLQAPVLMHLSMQRNIKRFFIYKYISKLLKFISDFNNIIKK